jgi:tight adherence protein C
MHLYVLLGILFLSTFAAVFSVLRILGRKTDPVVQRLSQVSRKSDHRGPVRGLVIGSNAEEESGVKSRFHSLLNVSGWFGKKDKEQMSRLKLSLVRAGYYRENSVRNFVSLKALIAITLIVICFIPWSTGIGGVPPHLLTAILMPLPIMGYFLPNAVLNSKIRRRQETIARGLPDALDFLVVCVEAGLGLNSSLIRVGQELQLKCKPLGEELLLVNREMRAGLSREHALRNLTLRSPIEDLRILVGSLILADRLGTSVARTLRAQAESLRTRVRQRAEEMAAQASIKMIFPLIFLILPALFIVIMGPGIILTLKSMEPALN